jgi:hypothetical protein
MIEVLTHRDIAKNYASADKRRSIVYADLERHGSIFEAKQRTGRRNVDWYASRQWTDEEKEAHYRQRRHPFVFNEIQHKIDHLIGTQTQTRMDIKAIAREKGDEPAAGLLTAIIKWVEQINAIEHIETQVFTDGLLKGIGAAVVRWELEDFVYGYPVVEKVPMNQLYWDLSAKSVDLKDARWMARVQRLQRGVIYELFPQHIETVRTAATFDTSNTYPSVLKVRSKLEDEIENNHSSSWSEDDREYVDLIEHYERLRIKQYVIIDDIAGRIVRYDDKREAEDFYNGLIDGYVSEGKALMMADGTLRVVLTSTTVDKMLQTIMVGDAVLENVLTDLADFPFIVFFSYFSDGDFWSFADSLIDPQYLVNRFFSQWDYTLGASHKNMVTVQEALLPRGWDIEAVRQEISRTAPVIPVMNHGAIQPHSNNPVNPELFQGIMFGIGRMNDYAGGRNALGLQENAAESGRAVMARAEQGGLARLPLFDKLRLWRQNLSYRLIWWIKNYMSPQQIVRIIGNDPTIQLRDIDDLVLNGLREIKTDIVVDEATKSESIRERQFLQMVQYMQTVQLPPEIASNILLELSELPESKKAEIKSQMQFYMQYQQQQQQSQHEQKLQREAEDAVKRKSIREQLDRSDELKAAEEQVKKQQKEYERQALETQRAAERAESANAEMQAAAPTTGQTTTGNVLEALMK